MTFITIVALSALVFISEIVLFSKPAPVPVPVKVKAKKEDGGTTI